jgi:hypothetical protein
VTAWVPLGVVAKKYLFAKNNTLIEQITANLFCSVRPVCTATRVIHNVPQPPNPPTTSHSLAVTPIVCLGLGLGLALVLGRSPSRSRSC